MADAETEEWAKKSKEIEAERMKAIRDLDENKADRVNLAYLDPKATRVKGWSNDPNVILASAERMGNRAIALAVAGVMLSIIGFAGSMVASSFKLGTAGGLISGLPSAIGGVCMGTGVLMGLIAVGSELYNKRRFGRKLTTTFWSGISAIAVIVVYFLAQMLIFRFI